MRKITEQAQAAWDNRRPFKKSNTEVRVIDGVRILFLFGFKIAQDEVNGNGRPTGEVLWTMCGYNTVTTRERLNGVLGLKITTKLGVPYAHVRRLPEVADLALPISPNGLYKLGDKKWRNT